MQSTDTSPNADQPSILVVEDDPSAGAYFARLLSMSGYRAQHLSSSTQALILLKGGVPFDAILSDIQMPEMTGIQFLQRVREQDMDVPVVLVTGSPNVETASKAVQYGAVRYLMKPVNKDELLDAVKYAVEVGKLSRARRDALESQGRGGATDLAGLETGFDRALQQIWMAFQPIVSSNNRRVFAHEALLRCEDKAFPYPGVLLDAAERLKRLPDLGRAVRAAVAERIHKTESDVQFFVNLHPEDLMDGQLYEASAPLTRFASRVVLEITEPAHLDGHTELALNVAKLRKLGFRIALDDLGAGYAGLNSFVRLKPDIVKIDMELVQGVHADSTKSSLVKSVLHFCTELKVPLVAEGVEHRLDHASLVHMGVDLLQGYAFSKPQRELAVITPEQYDVVP